MSELELLKKRGPIGLQIRKCKHKNGEKDIAAE